MDHIKNWWAGEAGKMQQMTWKQRLGYLAQYYKGWFFGILCLALLGFYFLDMFVQNQKDLVLQGFFADDFYNLFPAEYLEDAYGSHIGLEKGQHIIFDDELLIDLGGQDDMAGIATDYTAASNAKVMAYVSTGELDFVVSTRAVYDFYAGNLPMMDLQEVLPADLFARLKEDMITAPGKDGAPIYAALDMTGCRYIAGQNLPAADMALVEGEYWLFVPHNAPNVSQIADFIAYCFSDAA